METPALARRKSGKSYDPSSYAHLFKPGTSLYGFSDSDGRPFVHPSLRRVGWNHCVLTFQRFQEAAEEEGIRLLMKEMPDDLGRFYRVRGARVIELDPGLRGRLRSLVAWHEFGHAVLHEPGSPAVARMELEADIVGTCALLPQYLVTTYPAHIIAKRLGYPLEVVWWRIRMFRYFNL
jgi:hypothetical protein